MKTKSNFSNLAITIALGITMSAPLGLAQLAGQDQDLGSQLLGGGRPNKPQPSAETSTEGGSELKSTKEIVGALSPTRSTRTVTRTTTMSRETYEDLKSKGQTRGIEVVAVDANTVQATVQATDQEIAFDNLRFKINTWELADEESVKQLYIIAEALKELGNKGSFLIEGHTCDLGSDAHNQELSEMRAVAVTQFLAEEGIKCELVPMGFGESDPCVANTNEGNRAQNRRVVIRLKV